MDLHEMKLKVNSSPHSQKSHFKHSPTSCGDGYHIAHCRLGPLPSSKTGIVCCCIAPLNVCRADSDGDTSVRKGLAGWGTLLLPPWVLPPTFDFSHRISLLDMHFSYRPLQWEKVIFIIGALCYECDWGSQRENPWQDKHLFAIKHLMFSIGLKVCSSKRKRRSKITKFSIKITQQGWSWGNLRASEVVIFGSYFWILLLASLWDGADSCLWMNMDFQTDQDFLLDFFICSSSLSFSYTDLISSFSVPSNKTT